MSKNDVLVMITANRVDGKIEYKVECSSDITNEEFEYYLGELVKGICEWKDDICRENIRSRKGKIEQKEK